jgi:predicted ABC-type ATPase
MNMKIKNVYIIAGPNGAGKTTFAKKFLPQYAKCPNFINADLIAQGLAPFSPSSAAIQAGKLVLGQIRDFSDRGVDFSFETTLSGKTYQALIGGLQEKGYKVHIYFLWIPTSGLAISRIQDRVAEGGHNIPKQDARRRFTRSIKNFLSLYMPLADSWMLFNNADTPPELIAKWEKGHSGIIVHNEKLFGKIKKAVSKL